MSVFRPTVDSCGRLWFVDTGFLNYGTFAESTNLSKNLKTKFSGDGGVLQPASIWVFDLNTDSLIRRFEIPPTLVFGSAGLVSITVDVDTCDRTYAYIAAASSFNLVVYRYM